jgi:hypothetical protein
VIRQAAIESYDYLLTLLERYPRFRITLNIAGVLVEQLENIAPELLASLQSLAAARSAVRVRRPAREDSLRPTNEGGITQLRPAKNAHLNTMIGNRAWITVGTNEYALTVGESLPDGRTVTDINTQDRIVSLSDGSYVSGE